MNILIKVSGSISVYKICDLVSRLKKLGHSIKVASSENALDFVGAALWEGLSGESVFLDDFAPGQRMNHINLNDWADLVVLAPASAQTLNSIAVGVGSSVLTTLFLARKKEVPYLIFPAMNPRMWSSEPVQKAVNILNSYEAVKVFTPDTGSMACGHEGVGRLPEVSGILNEILMVEKQIKPKAKKVLISFGGTTEDIDGVRQISNFSSGRTGLEICKKLKLKSELTALGSVAALKGAEGLEGVNVKSFLSSSDLSNQLKALLSDDDYDLIIHAAAVSDFIPKNKISKKVSSSEDFKIEFVKAPKILDSLKGWSKNKEVKIVSFKLTHNQSPEEILEKIYKQFEKSESDFIIHNELGEITEEQHMYEIWKRDAKTPFDMGRTKSNMAESISRIGDL